MGLGGDGPQNNMGLFVPERVIVFPQREEVWEDAINGTCGPPARAMGEPWGGGEMTAREQMVAREGGEDVNF